MAVFLPDPKFANNRDEELAETVRQTDNRFRQWDGVIDLMEMSGQMTPEYFRLYIDASREHRLRRRSKTE